MAHPQIAAYARLADGNASAKRAIAGQKTLLSRTAHGIAYDEIRDRFMIPSFYGQAILVFKGGSEGEVAPVQVIQGPLTELVAPDRLAYDSLHNEIYIPQGDEVLVFDGSANGNVAPIRILKGPDTDMKAGNVAIDPVNNLMVVGGMQRKGDGQLQVFNRADNGNVKPMRTIRGPNTQLNYLFGPFAVHPPTGAIVAGIRTYDELASDNCFVGVWNLHDEGDVPPRWRIGGPQGILRQVRGVALDPAHKTLIVSDKRINGVLTFYFPEMF